MVEEFTSQQSSAPFNMALATLERISSTLIRIRDVSTDPRIPPEVKQAMKIQLVKQLFYLSSPLLPEKIAAIYENAVLDFQPKTLRVLKVKSAGNYSNVDEMKGFFDWNLETRLDMMVIDIQRELQREKYFMPPRRDLGRAVTQF